MTTELVSRGGHEEGRPATCPAQAAGPAVAGPRGEVELARELAQLQIELVHQSSVLRSTQSALEESRKHCADLYDFAPVVYFTLDLSGCILRLNLTAASFLGVEKQNVIGLPFSSVARVTEPEHLWQHIRGCVATQAPITREFSLATPHAGMVQVQATSVPEFDAKGNVAAVRTALADVSVQTRAQIERNEAIHAERALRTQLMRVDAAMALVTQALTQLDGHGSLPHVLQVIVEQARYVLSVDHAAFAVAEESGIGVGPWIPEAGGLNDNHLVVESLLSLPVRSRERSLGILYFSNKRDRSSFDQADHRMGDLFAERVATTIEIARLQDAARASIEARDHLLAIVSHDLRNPLSLIVLTAARLLRQGKERQAENGPMHMIMRAAARMSRLIDDLLQVATLEAGEFSVDPRPEDMRALFQEALESQQPVAAAKSISLVSEIPARLPTGLCDRERVLQVLANLIGNAVKFTGPGGTIRLAAVQRRDELCVSLADDGCGVAPSELPKLFDRFWKGKAQRHGGTGLGLSIVKGIVELHGGKVWAESGVGKGTTVSFTLPVAPDSAARAGAAALSAPGPTPVLRGKRVLLVDEGASAEALRTLSQIDGLVALGCQSGQDALEIFDSTTLDAIVLDMDTPNLDGLALLKSARAVQPGIPAIVMSGCRPADVEEALSMDSVDYVAKPIDVDALLGSLTQALRPALAAVD